MATTRSSGYSIGNTPPFITWTVVRGDSASFRVYVTDDAKTPLNIDNWDIEMEIKRPTVAQTTPTITDNASLIVTLFPQATNADGDGEFTVTLTPQQSVNLRTGDIFDIELSDPTRVWTVAQGSMIILEDVTNSVVS
jgi:hypothetical protein